MALSIPSLKIGFKAKLLVHLSIWPYGLCIASIDHRKVKAEVANIVRLCGYAAPHRFGTTSSDRLNIIFRYTV